MVWDNWKWPFNRALVILCFCRKWIQLLLSGYCWVSFGSSFRSLMMVGLQVPDRKGPPPLPRSTSNLFVVQGCRMSKPYRKTQGTGRVMSVFIAKNSSCVFFSGTRGCTSFALQQWIGESWAFYRDLDTNYLIILCRAVDKNSAVSTTI